MRPFPGAGARPPHSPRGVQGREGTAPHSPQGVQGPEGTARPLPLSPLRFHSFSLWEKEKSWLLPLKPITSLSTLKTVPLQNWSLQGFQPLDWKFGDLFPFSLLRPTEGRGRRGRLEGPHGCTHPSSGFIGHSPRGVRWLLLSSRCDWPPGPLTLAIWSSTLALLFYCFIRTFYQCDQQDTVTICPIRMDSCHENNSLKTAL